MTMPPNSHWSQSRCLTLSDHLTRRFDSRSPSTIARNPRTGSIRSLSPRRHTNNRGSESTHSQPPHRHYRHTVRTLIVALVITAKGHRRGNKQLRVRRGQHVDGPAQCDPEVLLNEGIRSEVLSRRHAVRRQELQEKGPFEQHAVGRLRLRVC